MQASSALLLNTNPGHTGLVCTRWHSTQVSARYGTSMLEAGAPPVWLQVSMRATSSFPEEFAL